MISLSSSSDWRTSSGSRTSSSRRWASRSTPLSARNSAATSGSGSVIASWASSGETTITGTEASVASRARRATRSADATASASVASGPADSTISVSLTRRRARSRNASSSAVAGAAALSTSTSAVLSSRALSVIVPWAPSSPPSPGVSSRTRPASSSGCDSSTWTYATRRALCGLDCSDAQRPSSSRPASTTAPDCRCTRARGSAGSPSRRGEMTSMYVFVATSTSRGSRLLCPMSALTSVLLPRLRSPTTATRAIAVVCLAARCSRAGTAVEPRSRASA